jgi:hypothetical protein
MYNEQEGELAIYKERATNADGYIEALRARLSKLAEREASTEVGTLCLPIERPFLKLLFCRVTSEISR